MFGMKITSLFVSLLALAPTALANSYKDYDNDFLDPTFLLAKNFSPETAAAQQTIVGWADWLAEQGPWSVMNKTGVAPTGNKHDYLSWAPYWWPNCTGVGNTTELTPEQIWVTCPYYQRDGQFNPDRLFNNNTGDFQAMSDAVFYNAIAWVLTGESNYSTNAAHFLWTWFLNPDTYVTPNLEYSQMERGPAGQIGAHTGLLDYRQMAKITTAILIMRGGKSAAWTTSMDTQMNNWTMNYLEWVETSPISLAEKASTNNHGSYWYNQVASLYILVGNTTAATATIKEYFSTIYNGQVEPSGEQPLEMIRTHPYHYRCYNLAAMIVNARIAKYLGLDYWNTTTTLGGTIKDAADFTMTVPLNTTDGDGPIWELYPSVASVASVYGDSDGKYAAFLASGDDTYPAEAYFLWTQPLSDSNLAAATPTAGGPETTSTSASTTITKENGAFVTVSASLLAGGLGALASVALLFV